MTIFSNEPLDYTRTSNTSNGAPVTDPASTINASQSDNKMASKTVLEMHHSLAAIAGVALQQQQELEGVWKGILNQGIIAGLCQHVINCSSQRTMLPAEKTLSPYFGALEALYNACCAFSEPPTPSDVEMICVLKENWTEMMKRLWNDPVNALEPDDTHVVERAIVAQIVLRLFAVDPSFIEVVLDPSDMTIPIVVRSWRCAVTEADIVVPVAALIELFLPRLPQLKAYFDEHPIRDFAVLISKILYGAHPRPSSLLTSAEASDNIVRTFTLHLNTLSGRDAILELDLLHDLNRISRHYQPTFASAVRRSAELWKCLRILLHRSAHNREMDSAGMHEGQIVLMPLISTVANNLHFTVDDAPNECEVLLQNWVSGGFFDALDDVMIVLTSTKGITMHLSRIYSGTKNALQFLSPSLLRAVRAEFPRSRSMYALIRHSTGGTGDLSKLPLLNMNLLRPGQDNQPDEHIWNQAAWGMLGTLTNAINDPQECGRRGCEDTWKSRCAACKLMGYCGVICQKRDWKEHKLVCQWMFMIEAFGREEQPANMLPPSHGERVDTALTLSMKSLNLGMR